MLAKEVKIKNLKMQREFIKRKLERLRDHPSEDGDTTFCYLGHLLPEVADYFKAEGYDITRVKSEALTSSTKGYPVYLFTISDKVTLTEEDLKVAEEVEEEMTAEESEEDLKDMLGLMSSMMRGF